MVLAVDLHLFMSVDKLCGDMSVAQTTVDAEQTQSPTVTAVDDTTSPGVLDRLKQMAAGHYDKAAAVHGGPSRQEATRTLKNGQMSSRFTMMVQVAVTLAIGTLILGEIFAALPDNSGPMANASDRVEELTGTAFELAPILLIVIVAALVINVVRGL